MDAVADADSIVRDDDVCNVVFYGATEHVQRRVIRLADTYKKRTYRFETCDEVNLGWRRWFCLLSSSQPT